MEEGRGKFGLLNVENDPFFDKDNLDFVPDPNYQPYSQEMVNTLFRKGRVTEFGQQEIEKRIHSSWNEFYRRHSTKIFKDRNWFFKEFPFLLERKKDEIDCLHLGCGVGNGMMPLLESSKGVRCVGLDFSFVAINILKKLLSQKKLDDQCQVQFHDIRKKIPFPDAKFDYVFLIFTLDAIHPKHHLSIFQDCFRILKDGGVLIFRDFAEEDATVVNKNKKEICDKFMIKGDGIQVYYFNISELKKLLIQASNSSNYKVEIEEIKIVERTMTNVKEGLVFDRRFVQLVCKKILRKK